MTSLHPIALLQHLPFFFFLESTLIAFTETNGKRGGGFDEFKLRPNLAKQEHAKGNWKHFVIVRKQEMPGCFEMRKKQKTTLDDEQLNI